MTNEPRLTHPRNLIQLEKGESGNLKEEVIAYAKVRWDPNDYITASYSSVSPVAFRDRFGEARLQTVQNHTRQYLQQQGLDDQNALIAHYPFLNDEIGVSEEDISAASEDVVYCGRFNDRDKAGLSIVGALIVHRNRHHNKEKQMVELMRLEKGDSKNLAGQVIAYAKVNGIFVASYSCIDPLDFRERIGIDELVSMQYQINQYLQQQGLEGNVKNAGFPFYKSTIRVTEPDLKTAHEDVVYVGELDDEAKAELSIMGAIMVHRNRHLSQREEKLGYPEGYIEGTEGQQVRMPSYNDLVGEGNDTGSIIMHLDWKYLIPIANAINMRDMATKKELVGGLLTFCKDSTLSKGSFDLADLLMDDEANLDLIGPSANMLYALVGEKYEEAARLRDRINATRIN